MVSEHFGFSNDEWDLLTEVPLEIYLAMLSADVAVDSFDAEEAAYGKSLLQTAEQCAINSWMRKALEQASRPTAAQAHGATSMSEQELSAHLEELADILKKRVGELDAHKFCELLVHFAERIAAASAGPFPGSPRVTKAEGDLIWRMRQALGLTHTLHP